MRDAVIVDLDGTLCDVTGIVHFVESEPPDFDAFHAAAIDCPVNGDVRAAVDQARDEGLAILIVTSRMARWRDYTIMWLDKHDIAFDALYTRIENDRRKDHVVKEDILVEIKKAGFRPVRAWEDSSAVTAMWRDNGIDVTEV